MAAGEVTYLKPYDHRLSEVLAAARALSTLPPPLYRPTDRLYLRSPERMEHLFADRPEALRNVASIAERCGGAVDLLGGFGRGSGGGVIVPQANLEPGSTEDLQLVRLALAGAKKLYKEAYGRNPEAYPLEEGAEGAPADGASDHRRAPLRRVLPHRPGSGRDRLLSGCADHRQRLRR